MRPALPFISLTQIPSSRSMPLLALIVCLMAFLSSNVPAGAVPSESPRIMTITVGGDRDYPPYEFIDKDGQPSGYNVELTRAIAIFCISAFVKSQAATQAITLPLRRPRQG